MSKKTQGGRLAMRVEGDWWVAYYALPATMNDGLELGRIRMAAVQDKLRREGFMLLMQAFISDIILEMTGVLVTWPDGPVPAPEHERAGRA